VRRDAATPTGFVVKRADVGGKVVDRVAERYAWMLFTNVEKRRSKAIRTNVDAAIAVARQESPRGGDLPFTESAHVLPRLLFGRGRVIPLDLKRRFGHIVCNRMPPFPMSTIK
jgi:hypothetical protein